MAVASAADLVAALRQHHLLEPGQLAELDGLIPVFPDPRVLAGELIKRNWLTAYQANQLLTGHAQELLLGSYVLRERLGEGGMGAVFKARNWKMGTIVALKLIRKERLTNPDSIRRFHREIHAAAKLDHPNIVRALDADEIAGTHIFVMECVDGLDLSKLVKDKGPVPVEMACDYIRQAALGLQHAFERGIVHRDIKPSNLLVSFSRDPQGSAGAPGAVETVAAAAALPCGSRLTGTVKILDMGLARLTPAAGEEHSSTLTETGAVMGTPSYMAPEQAVSLRPASACCWPALVACSWW